MMARGLHEQQLQKMQAQPGFIAALDQSGGSTRLCTKTLLHASRHWKFWDN
jgi:fructose-bisphosphate aldolase class 1